MAGNERGKNEAREEMKGKKINLEKLDPHNVWDRSTPTLCSVMKNAFLSRLHNTGGSSIIVQQCMFRLHQRRNIIVVIMIRCLC